MITVIIIGGDRVARFSTQREIISQIILGEGKHMTAEEIYYFLFDPKQGFGIQCLYTADGSVDEAYRVKNDELVELPYGFHATVTTPGYCSYLLWLMAGDYQGFNRSNDPIHDWIR